MIETEYTEFKKMNKSPVRNIKARVEHYKGSTLVETFNYDGNLKEFKINRAGENNISGYGVSQMITLKIFDKNNLIKFKQNETLKVAFGIGENYIYPLADFLVQENKRNEKNGELEIKGYDRLIKASIYTVEDIKLNLPYTLNDVVRIISNKLGVKYFLNSNVEANFNINYDKGANLEPQNTLRQVLDWIAKATQTIYFINYKQELEFLAPLKQYSSYYIKKNECFDIDIKDNSHYIAQLVYMNELGDNILFPSAAGYTNQEFIYANPFMELRNDKVDILKSAHKMIANNSFYDFDIEWRGNPLLEVGDRLEYRENTDNPNKYCYLINDELIYNGGLKQHSHFSYEVKHSSDFTNPSNIGQLINQTSAKVNKLSKEIELTVQQGNNLSQEFTQVKTKVGAIEATAEKTERFFNETKDEIGSLSQKVSQTITPDDLKIEIDKLETNGVNKIHTGTGYVFDENGLTVSKSGKEMETQITEDGMKVFKDGVEVLTANNIGVDAKNLHATTYLIIGLNSRFEDYANGTRTGCFWVG